MSASSRQRFPRASATNWRPQTGGEALEKLRSPGPDRVWFGRIYDRMQWTLGVALLNLFPLPRQSGFRKSFAYAGEAVDCATACLVFSGREAHRRRQTPPVHTEVGLLANNLRIPHPSDAD